MLNKAQKARVESLAPECRTLSQKKMEFPPKLEFAATAFLEN